MTGWRRWTPAERRRVGLEVLAARALNPPISWKSLARRYGRTMNVLYLYAKKAATLQTKYISRVEMDSSPGAVSPLAARNVGDDE